MRTFSTVALVTIGIALIYYLFFRSPDKKQKADQSGIEIKNRSFLRPKDKDRYKDNLPEDIPLTRENRPKIFKQTADEYRRRAQYPHYSNPIPIIQGQIIDPVKEDTTIIPAKVMNPHSESGPFIFHYLEKNTYGPGETIVFHAYLQDEFGKKMKTDRLKVTLADKGGKYATFKREKFMTDSGGYGDKAGDLIYTVTFPTNILKNKPYIYMLILKLDTDEPVVATNAFLFGELKIKLENEFEDEMDEDDKGQHLHIKIKMEVEKKGFFHFQASLYTIDGYPIGKAADRKELEVGSQWIDLKWYGKLFCDAEQDGPYVLKYFQFANVNQMPGTRSNGDYDLYTTGEYDYKEFTCKSFDDSIFLNKATAIEAEISEILSKE